MLHPVIAGAGGSGNPTADGIVLGIVLLLIVLCVVVLLLDRLTGEDHQVKADRWLDARASQYKMWRQKRRPR